MKLQEKKEIYEEYWERKNKIPLLSVVAPKEKQIGNAPKAPLSVRERWLDTEFVLKNFRFKMENTYFGGTAIPQLNPDLGPDIIGAICGCDIEFGEDTSWAKNHFNSLDEVNTNWSKDNFWYKGIVALTKAALKDSGGEYTVGITDLHPGCDALVSLRGPENLCFDLLECPDSVKRLDKIMFDVYASLYNDLFNIIKEKQGGITNWTGIWSSKRWYVTGCDFSCLIGSSDYREFVLPTIKKEVEFLDRSIYHLDGPDALRHLDDILTIEKLNGVQWVYGAGQPSAKYWLEVLRKIQAAGKNIEIIAEPDDVKVLCDNLSPKGLVMRCFAKNEEEAIQLEKLVESYK